MRGGEGAEVVYALRNNDTLASDILEGIGSEGQLMRKYYQRRLPENPMQDYYYIQRLTGDAETVLVEYGFIDNPRDAQKLQNNLEDYVEGAVRAIVNYAGYNYTPPVGSSTQYYTVQRGDSLWTIANRFGVTVNDLVETNNLSSNTLQIGQVLRIPTKTTPPNENTITYTVQRGDSLWSIANKYGVTVNIIRELNNLTTDTLQIGQQLLIPSQIDNEQPTQIVYTVKKGDSLWTIARQYDTTIAAIKELNNLTSNVLSIGQQLYIPTSGSTDNTPDTDTQDEVIYIVQRGDSLWLIAQKYNINVNDLKQANNLTSNTLQIGDKLIIPGQSSSTMNTYVVQPGDSLWLIARNNNTTVEQLKLLNNLTSNTLQIGQVLRLR